MSEKRKRVCVPLEKKLEALKRVDRGHTIRKVANELGVGEVTVGDWKRRRQELEEWCWRSFETDSVRVKRKTMKKGEFNKTSEALFMWFLQMKEEGNTVSGPILQSKALELNMNFREGDGFTASNSWFDRWKKRFGIGGKRLNLTQKNLSGDTDSLSELNLTKKKLLEDAHALTTDKVQIITEENDSFDESSSCDESAINCNIPSMKTTGNINENLPLELDESKDGLPQPECSDLSGECNIIQIQKH